MAEQLHDRETGVLMDETRALALAQECLLIRAEQWAEIAEFGAIQPEPRNGNMKGDCLNMSKMYRAAHECLAKSA